MSVPTDTDAEWCDLVSDLIALRQFHGEICESESESSELFSFLESVSCFVEGVSPLSVSGEGDVAD